MLSDMLLAELPPFAQHHLHKALVTIPDDFHEDAMLLLQEAKVLNRKKADQGETCQIAFDLPSDCGWYNRSEFVDVRPVNQDDYDAKLLRKVRYGLADFGTKDDKFCSDKFCMFERTGDYTEHICDSAQYIWADPIYKLYIHNPCSLKEVSSQFDFSTEKWQIKFPSGDERRCSFTRCRPKTVTVICQSEAEFTITKGVDRVRPWAKWASPGINCAFDETKTKTYTSDQALVEVKVNPRYLKPRGKITLNISEAKAKIFLEHEAQLRALKLELENTRELEALTNERNDEIKNLQQVDVANIDAEAFASVAHQSRMTQQEMEAMLKQLPGESSNFFLCKVSGQNVANTYLVSLKAGYLEFQLIENNALSGAQVSSIIKKRFEILSSSGATFQQLRSNASNFNNVAGFAFEDIMNARIMEAAAKKGVPLQLIEGDGAGLLHSGHNVPDYVDAVFYNPANNEYTGHLNYL